ncbi:MAG: triacylglycerol esterase/lipase EstA (alpha/beta hydrolase family) [Myxococcota bacterium]|jgi:triacylglycerol esterase/lipase EstA (alpha/beta hydrolase family)
MSVPTVLVHGYLCPKQFMLPLKWRLARKGFDPHLVDLSPLCIQDVRTLAGQLRENVDRVRQRTGAERVVLVGVSQGALIALQYLHHEGGAEAVSHFVAVGAPLRGTWFALVGLPLLGGVSRGIWQTLPGSSIVDDLQRRGVPKGVQTTVVSMVGDVVAPPSRCRLAGAEESVLPASFVPAAHQWLIMSRRAADAVDAAVNG